jgi:hypothetical protein
MNNKFANLASYSNRGKHHVALFACFIFAFGVAGYILIFASHAAVPTASTEAESGVLSGGASAISDPSASGGSAIRFGSGVVTASADPSADAGANLPISYSLSSLTGTVLYVSPGGSDTAAGTVSAPFATLAKGISAAPSGGTVVVRGGTYRQGNLTIPATKSVRIVAYPGETPVFDGSQAVSGGWISESNFRYIAYTPQPVTDGSGVTFTTGQGLNGDGVGKYPDQAWAGNTELRQVSAKTSLVDGTFWVDRTNNRLYMTDADSAKSGVEVSQKNVFMSVQGPNSTLEGLKIQRYSNTAGDTAVINVLPTADNSLLRNVDISDAAFVTVAYVGNTNLNDGSTLDHVTVNSSNWMGISAVYTDNLTLNHVRLTNMNSFNEFAFSPKSGGMKTSKTQFTKVLNSVISNNNSHGLWFDQSNYDVQVANNTLIDNSGASVFFEISDNLLMVNNYIKSVGDAQPVKTAGSSGLKLINNTLVGGKDPFSAYTDSRSMPGCSDPAKPLCSGYSSDRDTVRPHVATLDWIPRIDMMFDNIIAYPTNAGLCGVVTAVCVTQSNASAVVSLDTTIHHADTARGIPQTQINGDVYVGNSTGVIFSVKNPLGRYTTTGAFATAMAGTPVLINGFETVGHQGATYVNADGSPTDALASIHSSAYAVPTNTTINKYVPAGTKHYGVTWK